MCLLYVLTVVDASTADCRPIASFNNIDPLFLIAQPTFLSFIDPLVVNITKE